MPEISAGPSSLEKTPHVWSSDSDGDSHRESDLQLKYLRYLCHDMNNNLGGISLELQEIRQRLEASPGRDREVAALDAARETIERTAAGMRELLRREQGQRRQGPVHQRFDLHGLVNTVVHQFTAQAQRRGIDLVADVPADAIIESSSVLIALVLQNLICNAVKHGVPGIVRVAARRPAGALDGAWTLSVTDSGPGIPRDELKRIFASEERGGTDAPGFGIGLAIATDVARQLGGKLSVDSQVGVGSTFQLALPGEMPSG